MVATLFLLAACSPQRALEAARLLSELAAGAGSEQPAVLPPPVRRLVLGGRSAPADLYFADAAPEAALVLVPGLVPEGKDDPRLVALVPMHISGKAPPPASPSTTRTTSSSLPPCSATATCAPASATTPRFPDVMAYS
jgi:hypothetical protein